jgi:hypothetical protein
MKTIPHNIRTSGLLIGAIMLSMSTFAAVAETESEQTATVDPSVAMYAQGVSWDQFLSGARVQRKTWLKNAERDVPPGLIDRFKQAGNNLQLLIITADWCPDSAHSVPYIAKLASGAGVDLRLVDFKTGKAIMDTHLTPDGRASTPTVVLLRGDKEVAAWVERPSSLQWWYLDMADQLSEEERMERKMSWYDWNRGSDTLTEIVVLAEQTANQAPSASRSH